MKAIFPIKISASVSSSETLRQAENRESRRAVSALMARDPCTISVIRRRDIDSLRETILAHVSG